MNKEKFNNLFAKYNVPNSRSFTVNGWDNALKEWDSYYKLIKSPEGLPLNRWLKPEKESDGYLPDFLDTKEKVFGHARIGNYDQVMIYKFTGTDEERNGRFINNYRKNDSSKGIYGSESEIEDDYNDNIRDLLREIVNASSPDALYGVEKSDKYKEFSNKQILRKMSILTSLRDDSKYKNEFMWIYNEKDLDKLAEILEVDIDSKKTFLEKNKTIYDKAKGYVGMTNSSKKWDYIKLNNFLWYLSGSDYETAELLDFNSINIIFNGAPGTGKTYGVTEGIEKLQNIDSSKFKDSKYIQFHPTYTYQDFIEGIKPIGITTSGNLDLQVVNGSFKQFCIKVRRENEEYYSKLDEEHKPNPKEPSSFIDWPHYYFVVDEINRGNLSSIFGETFTLLEYRDYDFSGNYDKPKTNLVSTALSSVIAKIEKNEDLIYKKIDNEIYFGIPFNIHFVGMMNDVDRSIDSFDLALRRRFKWVQKYCDYDVINDVLTDKGYQPDDIKKYIESCKSLNKIICDTANKDGLRLGKNYEIGHAFYLKVKDIPGNKTITDNKKKEVFESYIAGTLKEYIRQVADDSEIDGWIDKARTAFGIN